MKVLDLAPDKKKSSHSLLKQCMLCSGETEVLMYTSDYNRWRMGTHIQRVFPELSADDREMIISGTHNECWEKMYGDDND